MAGMETFSIFYLTIGYFQRNRLRQKYLVLVTEISGSGNRDLGRAGLQVSPCHVRDLQGRQRFRPEYFDERYEL